MTNQPGGRTRRQVAILEARALRLGYGSNVVLEHVDLRVGAGEFWFLLGPNGTGKSTFIRALLGMLRPLKGAVIVHPEVGYPERLGYVPSNCSLNPGLPTTVREVLLLGLVGIRCRRADRVERVHWALERVGLSGMDQHDYGSLSDGQRRRVMVARALARRPRLLIMDEPTNGLDPAAEAGLLEHVARLNRAETLTTLFVTHNLAIAARYATHVALFHNCGVEAGPTSQIMQRAKLERVYGAGLGHLT